MSANYKILWVILKFPHDTTGRKVRMSTNTIQKILGLGRYIDEFQIEDGMVLLTNKNGKLKNLTPNFFIRKAYYDDIVCGPAIICGRNKEGLCDVPISMKQWNQKLRSWENWPYNAQNW